MNWNRTKIQPAQLSTYQTILSKYNIYRIYPQFKSKVKYLMLISYELKIFRGLLRIFLKLL